MTEDEVEEFVGVEPATLVVILPLLRTVWRGCEPRLGR